MKNIAVAGAGGFGREVKMLIDQINQKEPTYKFLGFFDDGIKINTIVNGFPILGTIDDINKYENELCIVLAIGNPSTKKRILERIKNNLVTFPILKHPTAIIGNDDVVIGEGTIICAGNIITVNINIGKHVILNLSCTVGHDTQIGDFCSFMPSVNISGEVNIDDCVYVGTGAKIINQLNIGKETIIGAGSLVAKSLPEKCTAVGVPARPIKFN